MKTIDITVDSRDEFSRLPGPELQALLDSISDVAIVASPEDEILYVNKSFVRERGYAKLEVVGMDAKKLMGKDRVRAEASGYSDLCTTESIWTRHGTRKTKGGEEREVEAIVHAIEGVDGRTEYLVIIERPRDGAGPQASLRHTQQLEALGALTQGIAHDFNNILTGILGYTELLRISTPSDSDAMNYLNAIYSAGERARSLIKQIHALSRKIEQERQKVDLQTIAKEALKLLRSSIPTNVSVRHKFEESPQYVLGYPTQLYQVIMNLCTNAFHAMSGNGGTLDLSISSIENPSSLKDFKGASNPNPQVLLAVKDSGCGMDEDTLSQIFVAGFTTKGEDEGMGLGLATVWGIVKTHGGTISVQSSPNVGTEFQITLPLCDQRSSCEIAANPRHAPLTGSGHVILVDTDDTVVEVLRLGLARLGFDVTACASYAAALETIGQCPGQFDTLIVDSHALESSEIETNALRSSLPVILCIDACTEKEEMALNSLDQVYTIQKPISITELVTTIKRVMMKGEVD